MANRVVVKPNPDIVAPSVGIAPARAKPSFIGALANEVLPTMKGMAKSRGGEGGMTDRLYILELDKEFKDEVSNLQELGEFTPEKHAAMQGQYESKLAEAQIRLGVPRVDLDSHNKIFGSLTDQGQYFQAPDKGMMSSYYDSNSGKYVVNLDNMDAEQAAGMRQQALDAVSQRQLADAQVITDPVERDKQMSKLVETGIDRVSRRLKLEQDVAMQDAIVKKNNLTKEAFQQKTQESYDDFRVMGRGAFNDHADYLVQQVKENKMTSEDAKSAIREWVSGHKDNPDTLTFLDSTNRDMEEYEKIFDDQLELVDNIFDGRDPKKKFQKETLHQEALLRYSRAKIFIDLPPGVYRDLILQESITQALTAAVLMEDIERPGAILTPLLIYKNTADKANVYDAEVFLPLLEKSEAEQGRESTRKGSATLQLSVNLYNVMRKVNKKDFKGSDAVTPQYAVEAYSKFKATPNYKQLSPKAKKALEDQFLRIKLLFDKRTDLAEEFKRITGAPFETTSEE